MEYLAQFVVAGRWIWLTFALLSIGYLWFKKATGNKPIGDINGGNVLAALFGFFFMFVIACAMPVWIILFALSLVL